MLKVRISIIMNYYSLFQPLIDLSSITEIYTKGIIRDNTRKVRSECMLLKILAREFIR